MKELINFSNYQFDIDQFSNVENDLPIFLKKHHLHGIELLIGYDQKTVYPQETIYSVHLPFWVTWLDVFNQKPGALESYYEGMDKKYYKHMCGGTSPEEMCQNMYMLWNNALRMQAQHAVLHACHVELEHSYTRQYTYSNMEVLRAFASLLNKTAAMYPDGEPPVTIALENLWWPGLTFIDHQETLSFMEMLEFKNWHFVLDTGHLMNAFGDITNRQEASDRLLEWIETTPTVILDKIKTLHLSYSGSATYQKESVVEGSPNDFQTLSFYEKYGKVSEHVFKIDHHQAFSSSFLQEIIDRIAPDTLVHEFLGSLEEKTAKLIKQKECLGIPILEEV